MMPSEITSPLPHGHGSDRRRSLIVHACAIVLIGLAVAVIGGRGMMQGGVGWSDGANHLFDGIFIYEFVRDWPIAHPMAWAEQFYLHHPSLGIVVYWPPGFAAIEAAVFAIFGVSLVAARLLVLAFAFGAAYVLYRLVRDVYDDGIALIAALLFATCPFGERWMTDIMLEWPATFWILLAVWAYVRGTGIAGRRVKSTLGESTTRASTSEAASANQTRIGALWSVACGLAIAAAFLTKQTAGFILPVIIAHALLTKGGCRWLRRLATITGFAVCGAIVLAYMYMSRPYAGLASKLLAWDFDGLWYARHGVEIFGWGILAAAAFCIALSCVGYLRTLLASSERRLGVKRRPLPEGRGSDRDGCDSERSGIERVGRRFNRPALLFAFWFVAWYTFSSAIEAKEPRYLFFALPPAVIAAAFGIRRVARTCTRRSAAPWVAGTLATLVIVCNTALAVANSRGRLPSYAAAVKSLVDRGDADLVLIDAMRDGQFVFDVYQNEAARGRIIPLRASKLLYARAARMKYGGELRVESDADIVALLNRLGIRYVVMESQPPHTQDATIDPRPRKLLRSLVADSSRFALRGAWPLACDDPDWDNVELRVYEYLDCPPRTTDHVTIPVPAMGRDVEIELPQ